ncbi:MAG: 50S ribosomal protein L17 [Bacillota bacterium]
MRPKKLNRPIDQRRALLRGLVTSILEHERIETTAARAEAAQPIVEKMITIGKRGDLHARRQIAGYLTDRAVARKVCDVLGPRYEDRPGGYTRIIKTAPRRGDGAPMVILELV